MRLLQFADSPHEQVRETVFELLPNIRFDRFFQTFDKISEEQRRTLFKLVKVMDPETVNELAKLLAESEPLVKIKALLCIGYGDLVPALEDAVCGVLTDGETPLLRIAAAKLLAKGRREMSRSILVQALHRDNDPVVRAAAKTSLENRPVAWKV
jgi:HEAT repeat protein